MTPTDPNRHAWLAERKQLESRLADRRRTTPAGEKAFFSSSYMKHGASMFFRLLGLHRNTRDLRLEHVTMSFPELPDSFSGYTILHLSDLHIGDSPCIPEQAARHFSGVEVDLVVMSGDYQTWGKPAAADISATLAQILGNLTVRDHITAVLGNHDSHEMAEIFDQLGVRILVNEGLAITRGEHQLTVVGTDDVHCFFTESAPAALRNFADGFRIAVVHTPDLASVAAEAGYSLYLTGHTHGGQICLPDGKPLITCLDTHHGLASGNWKWKGMLGHTSRGLGAAIPARLNCPPEATIIELKSGSDSSFSDHPDGAISPIKVK